MSWESAQRVASALLYEGYVLYPYRRSALKNQFRWQFGVVAPPTAQPPGDGGRNRPEDSLGNSPSWVQTQCLFEPAPDDSPATIDVMVRFLHLEQRRVERAAGPGRWEPVDTLAADGVEVGPWDEARPTDLLVPDVPAEPVGQGITVSRTVAGGRTTEVLRRDGQVVGRIVRERRPVSCDIHVAVEPAGRFRKVTVRVANVTVLDGRPDAGEGRDALLRRSLVSAHTLLRLSRGAFLSMMDPPPDAAEYAALCENRHTWPVLAGDRGSRAVMLSSPITLYDHPGLAPESAGELCDGTEIDELLTLRVMTLTDAERRAAAATDPVARAILDRVAALPAADLGRMHGAVRQAGLSNARQGEGSRRRETTAAWEAWLNPPGEHPTERAVHVRGCAIRAGSRVRVWPRGRADAMDMFLMGATATVAGVYRDLEDNEHVAVTLDEGRAADLHAAVGRYFYFRPDEIDPLDLTEQDATRLPGTNAAVEPRTLVAGIGNIFLGDDGFGPAVIQRLSGRRLPDSVKLEDYGIRGIHLAHELLSGRYDSAILVDAIGGDGPPGSLYVIEPDLKSTDGGRDGGEVLDAHAVNVDSVLALLTTLDEPTAKNSAGVCGRILVVGCQPASLGPGIGLSDPVLAMVDAAAARVVELVTATRA